MKRKPILAGLLACLLCIGLWGCGADTGSFDAEKDGILNVVVYDEKTEALSYEVIDSQGRRQLTEEFELDPLTVLYADNGSFQSSVVDGKVVNTVVSVDVYTEDGELAAPDAIITEIFNQTAAIHDQEILALDIIMCEGRYFPVVDLNVNLQAPVILYHFSTETNTMTELCRYDSVVIGGLQILDPEKLP